jgi:four helix bundle protein
MRGSIEGPSRMQPGASSAFSLDELPLVRRMLGQLPRGERELREQLGRAARSVPANIAEGAGKLTVADRARAHAIARGSALECGAWLDIGRIEGLLLPEDIDRAKALLVRIVVMLTTMARP